ncbi:MAG: hypothetical protein EOP24_46615 [Hyphomicrobiales bacterium]|nr:MAG: hypothetical protein EOP24_46615 [Hyphomicrobiales bacterium]
MRSIVILLVLFTCNLAQAQEKALLLFGGAGHKTFLGCLNCGKYDSGSICNKYGEYGSKYSSTSIWNKYGEYGSKYSPYSPWNRYASEPPAIVDRDGGFYGYLTASEYNPKRTRIKLFVTLTDLWKEITDDPEPIADKLCGRE